MGTAEQKQLNNCWEKMETVIYETKRRSTEDLITEDLISDICDEIKKILINKNKAYGNSVFEPVKIFSKTNTEEQINVRIDDKLSRLMKGSEYQGEDTETDLIGYLILKKVLKRYKEINNENKKA